MFGLLLLILIYLFLGFLLAWVAGIVAREEVEVKTGVLILVAAALVGLFARILLRDAAPDAQDVLLPLINFVTLTLLIKIIAGLTFKHSVIIAAIYTAILFALGFGLMAMLSA